MIKAKQVFFWASNLKGHGFHDDKATILYLTLKYYLLFVLTEKLYFLKIGAVNQKLWSFNPIQAGGEHIVPPYRFFPCCAETVCSRLIKLSDV